MPALWEATTLPWRPRSARDTDVLWHPANGTFFSSSVPSVATIHDAVPFRYPNPDEKRREHMQGPFLRSARDASRIIAVSEFGRSEVHETLGVELERIAVIPHGVEREFLTRCGVIAAEGIARAALFVVRRRSGGRAAQELSVAL